MVKPFILDTRLPEDTLFWIIEEDFRFWPPGQDPDNADNYDEEMWYLFHNVDAQGGAESSLPPSQDTTSKEGKKEERATTEYHTALPKGHSDESDDQDFSQDVIDIMRIATMCHRVGMGEIIWVSWVPKKDKPSRLGHGSTCLLLTKMGMAAVSDAKDRGVLTRGDIDVVLNHWLLKYEEACKAKACYLYPPIGSYTEHASECDPKQFGGDKTRPSGFDSGENPCHGTRLAGDPKGRAKFLLQWKGGWAERIWTPFLDERVLHSERMLWKSMEDPNAQYSLQQWKNWHRNPGKTHREKRLFRQFLTMMMKRNWTTTRGEAK